MSKLRFVRTITLAALSFVTWQGAGFAQGVQAVKAEIPYQFILGTTPLPPGRYTLVINKLGLQVQSRSGQVYRASIVTRLGGPSALFEGGSLVFDRSGDTRILSEVWMAGAEGILLHSTPKGHSHEVVLLSEDFDETHTLSGKSAYSQTCIRCHGPNGKGDKAADKFFNKDIPRLNAPTIQAKSDQELRAIITQGSNAMPPVETDEAGFRHRLPPQDVDAVIAYVRSFKQ